jgi:hypothetical protein
MSGPSASRCSVYRLQCKWAKQLPPTRSCEPGVPPRGADLSNKGFERSKQRPWDKYSARRSARGDESVKILLESAQSTQFVAHTIKKPPPSLGRLLMLDLSQATQTSTLRLSCDILHLEPGSSHNHAPLTAVIPIQVGQTKQEWRIHSSGLGSCA